MKKYSSKILLFGEHSVLKGSQALAMPLFIFHGSWKYATTNVATKQQNLQAFAAYLENLKNVNELLCDLDVSKFKSELQKGLYFESNIPTGYGVGSSGALCAAVYDVFEKNKLEKTEVNFSSLKKIFAQLESFFHGSSSGTDPLICFLEKVILLEPDGKIEDIYLPLKGIRTKDEYQFFLLDTKIPRETSPFVYLFLEKCKDQNYFNRIQAELNPTVDEAIQAFFSENVNVLFEKIHEIGHFQFKYFSEMIPADFRAVWLDSLASDFFKLKLCGAGGGGFILGMSLDFEKTKQQLVDYDLIPIL